MWLAMPKATNAELARVQIAGHGVDRYPTPRAQFIKLVEEVGELGKEINRESKRADLEGECADVALSLYTLCAKLGIDLDRAIQAKVKDDTRTFT